MLPRMTTTAKRASGRWAILGAGVCALGASAMMNGCALGQLFGGMAASAHRAGSHDVEAKYRGLTDKSFAVVIAADRTIQSEYGEAVIVLTRDITRRLSENAGASGVLPAEEVLAFQFQRPSWAAMSPQDVAKELEVDRLVYIDITEFTLVDPGNKYEWKGVAAGSVSVVEAEVLDSSGVPFRETVRVTFPDSAGVHPDILPANAMFGELCRRFAERTAWMFYDHEEPNIIKY